MRFFDTADVYALGVGEELTGCEDDMPATKVHSRMRGLSHGGV